MALRHYLFGHDRYGAHGVGPLGFNLFRGMVLISTDPARLDGGGDAVAT